MKNLVKRFGQFVNENHDDNMFSPNTGDDNMLPNRNRYDRYEESGYDDEGNYIKDKMSDDDLETCDCVEFDDNGDCVECGSHEDMERQMGRTMYNRGEEYQRSKIDRQISRHNMGKMDNMSEEELYEAKKQEKIEALDAIDKKFAKMKPAKKSMPMKSMPMKSMTKKPMTKKTVEMEEEESSMKPKRVINESQSVVALDMAKNAISKSTQADTGTKDEIINCIKSGSYSHLMVLTTGVGATALGALAILLVSGVGTVPALIIMAAGAVITTIEGMMTTTNSGRGSVNDELTQLYNCLKAKGII